MDENDKLSNKNSRLALKLAAYAVLMFGFGYALIPFYNALCCWAGINGKGCSSEVVFYNPFFKSIDFDRLDVNRNINVEFITTLNNNTPMEFRAETSLLKIHPGENNTVNFYAKNTSDHEITVRAIPSFSPGLTADYFRKTECFCFDEQTLKAKEAKTMPVKFVVSADLPEQYKTITLSYTFFDNTGKTVK
jgi:cytochrome c oxidase assembly protein subunit 11